MGHLSPLLLFPGQLGADWEECGDARPGRPVSVSSSVAAFSWSVRPVTLACIWAIGLHLGCPFDDQAAATYFFGFVSSPYPYADLYRQIGHDLHLQRLDDRSDW